MTKIITERPDWCDKKFVRVWEGNNNICEYYWLDFGTTPNFENVLKDLVEVESVPEPIERYYAGFGVFELYPNNIVIQNVIGASDDYINTQRIFRLEE